MYIPTFFSITHKVNLTMNSYILILKYKFTFFKICNNIHIYILKTKTEKCLKNDFTVTMFIY